MISWFSSLSIRWKLQFGFFAVTMVTTIYNRWLAASELGGFIHIAKQHSVDPQVVVLLQQKYDGYIFNSFWESGIEFAIQFVIIGIVASLFVKPIKALCVALKAIEEGDLTNEIASPSHDEIGVLQRSFNGVLAKLNSIMHRIDESGKQMGQSAYQIAMISHEIAEVGKNENQRSQAVTNATQQLNDISESVQLLANEATESARQTESHAQDGIEKVRANIQLMQKTAEDVQQAANEIFELKKAAEKINNIVTTISTVAEQTNLLSLNAAIEAARAGEQGRGFAVVADEVRNLARGTSDSVEEISQIITTLTNKVQLAAEGMNSVVQEVQGNQQRAGDIEIIFGHMSGVISETAAANHKIFDASREQMEQFQLLRSTLDQLFETLNASSSKVETTATIGDDLYRITEKLNALMRGFRFNHYTPHQKVENEKRKHPRAENSLLVKVHHHGHTTEGISSDFSLSGIQVRLCEPIGRDESISMDVYLPHDDLDQYASQEPLQVQGRVAWHRPDEKEAGRHYIGVKFENVDDYGKKRLEKCFAYFNKDATFTDAT
jgi:methyl-accepting chemotaxis protein